MSKPGRKPKQQRLSSAQLKLLDSLPEMLEALRLLAAQYEEIRQLTSSGSAQPQRAVAISSHAMAPAGAPAPSLPPPAVIMTPERREYLDSLASGTPLPAPGEERQLELPSQPVGQDQVNRQAAQRAFLASLNGQKVQLLQQFAKDGKDGDADGG